MAPRTGAVEVKRIEIFFAEKFGLENAPADAPFSQLLPQCYAETGRHAAALFDPGFFPKCNGLMLRGSSHIECVALAVFLSDEAVTQIEHAQLENCLLFTHHPLDMETSNRGFLPLSQRSIQILQDRHISVYSLHNPLDRNAGLNTSLSLARLMGLTGLSAFSPDGLVGCLPERLSLDEFATHFAQMLSIPAANSVNKTDQVHHIALLAGGGSNARFLYMAVDRGVDTYVTGTYDNQIRNPIGQEHRRQLREFLDQDLALNLVEGSHYATEAPVLFNDIAALVRSEFGLPTHCFPQSDPWH